jgi:hypothetical protein
MGILGQRKILTVIALAIIPPKTTAAGVLMFAARFNHKAP